MKRKNITPLLIIMVILVLTGCSSNANSSVLQEQNQNIAVESSSDTDKTTKYTDIDFVVNLSKGLEARWNLTDADDKNAKADENYWNNKSVTEQQKIYNEYVDAETDMLGRFEDYEFENEELKDLAEKYFHALSLQKEGIQYLGVDDAKYQNTFTRAYYYRIYYIYDLYMNYGLTIDDSYKSTMDELVTNYTYAKEYVEVVAWIDDIENSLQYSTSDEDDKSYKEYNGIIENTTEYTLSYVSIDIDLLDENGIVVDQATDSLNNVVSGEKYQTKFSSNADFTKQRITISVNF